MKIVKGSRRSEFAQRFHDGQLDRKNRRRAQVVFAAETMSGPSLTLPAYQHLPPVDLAATAIEASKSPYLEDQRAGHLTAIESLLFRGAPLGWPELPVVLDALNVLRQVYEGDQSSPLIPARKSGRPYSSRYYEGRARAMIAALVWATFEDCTLEVACLYVAKSLDKEMQPYARLWDVFLLEKPSTPEHELSIEASLAREAEKLKRWIDAESRKQPDRDALPIDRTAKKQFLVAKQWLENARPAENWKEVHAREIRTCATILLQLSKKAQDFLAEQS